jgi:uncharacterized protein
LIFPDDLDLDSSAPPPVLLVFAKEPEPGRVKTRIARSLGEEEAARIYRRMGRHVIDRVRRGGYRTVICFDPPARESAIHAWLGTEALEFVPQSRGDLGERMERAFEWGFERSDRVCAIGTDAPRLDGTLVESAFAHLATPGGPDVVFGPAEDGGYYLLALRRPVPTLFRDIPWSTDQVLEKSLAAVDALGLRVELLQRLTDVDREEDVPAAFRSDCGDARSRQ